MNTFTEVIAGLRKRASADGIMKTLEALEGLDVLRDLPDEGGKKPRVRLPYSSDPRSFEERWR